jgi:hypothetical protein
VSQQAYAPAPKGRAQRRISKKAFDPKLHLFVTGASVAEKLSA